MKLSKQLPTPTPELVRQTYKEFDEKDETDETLRRLINQFPQNTNYAEVLVKAASINLLYSTWIIGITTVARHIVTLDIDSHLNNNDDEIVDKIASVKFKNKVHCNYSFATKYCGWHKPESYPIWDSRVDECLWVYRKQHRSITPNPFPTFKKRSDLWTYNKFRVIVKEFISHYGLTEFSFKQIDKFLYQLGNEYFPRE